MLDSLVVALLLLAAGCALCGYRQYRRRRRRRRDTMVVTTIPSIELEQPYGAWDADAYDAHRYRRPSRVSMMWRSGPPSSWGRML